MKKHKKYRAKEVTFEGVTVEVISDYDHTNTFVVNGTICNGFINLREFMPVLRDSLEMEGIVDERIVWHIDHNLDLEVC